VASTLVFLKTVSRDRLPCIVKGPSLPWRTPWNKESASSVLGSPRSPGECSQGKDGIQVVGHGFHAATLWADVTVCR
jgi:hypothetical protein